MELLQPNFNLQIAIILGRFPGIRELMDAKLFLNKELDKDLKPSSKMKYASDFISVGTHKIVWIALLHRYFITLFIAYVLVSIVLVWNCA